MATFKTDTHYLLYLSREEAVFLRDLLAVTEIDEDKMGGQDRDIEDPSNLLIHLHDTLVSELGTAGVSKPVAYFQIGD